MGKSNSQLEELANLLKYCKKSNDDKSIRELFGRLRWGDSPACPHCASLDKVYVYKCGKLFKCGDCKKQFTVTVGTIFEKTHLPLYKWFQAIILFLESKKGISSHQLGRMLDVQQKTAWFLLQKIRFALVDDRISERKMFDKLRGVIEVDETFIGGKNKNRHFKNRKKLTQGRSLIDKTPVFGILQRDGFVRTFVVTSTDGDILQGLIRKNVVEKSVVISDSWGGYRGLNRWYHHEIVKHSEGNYVRGNLHTNGIEGFWSNLKRGLGGTYGSVTKRYLQRYCDEFAFRYNRRENELITNFQILVNKLEFTLLQKNIFNRAMMEYGG